MNVLYIYGGNKNKSHNLGSDCKVFLYRVGMGNIDGNNVYSINDASLLNNIATNSANDYCEFIYSINKLFLKYDIVYDSKYSLYFLGDISGKRTELFDTYNNYCNSLYLREWANNNCVDKIIIDHCRKDQIESIGSVLPSTSISTNNAIKSKKSLIKNILSNIVFYAKVAVGASIRNIFIPNKYKENSIKNLFLTRFPLHLNYKFDEDKYGDLVGKNDFYLVNLFSDGMHQNISIINYLKYTNYLHKSDNIIIVDDYINVRDIYSSFIYSLKILKNYKKLLSESFAFNGVHLSSSIYLELILSYSRSPRLLMWRNAIHRICDNYKVGNLYYYLHEYPYGRLFTLSFKEYSDSTTLIGFQHGPSSERKLLYMAARGELSPNGDKINSFPTPDSVLSEEDFSKKIYINAGYVNVKRMGRVYRLYYLNHITRNHTDNNYLLIAPGLHDGDFLMRSLYENIKNNYNSKYLLKPHPRANNIYINKYKHLGNFSVTNLAIYEALSIASKVFATYSSVALEAKIIGIDIQLIDLPGKINESPFLDESFHDVIDRILY